MNNEKLQDTICFNQELGELLLHTSTVATAIRMNSPYSSEYNKVVSGLKQFGFGKREDIDKKFDEQTNDVMLLSDSLQQFGRLAQALTCNNLVQIDQACSSIITMYTQDMTHPDTAKTFQRWDGTISKESKYYRPQFSLQEGIDILQKIKDKISEHSGL